MNDVVLEVVQLGFPWVCADPFLFCAYHDDAYPAGDERMAPAASLAGRELGMDFAGKDGWRMYHGEVVPGFPQHPHRGFETVTIVRRGLVDHSDSLGATARFGEGDVQWLTAGRGIVHSEMFPLLKRDADNPLELFQIWLNLPKARKMVAPYFSMLWAPSIPVHSEGGTKVTMIAGALGDARTPAPPPDSWAAQPDSDVAIWTIAMQPGAKWTMPPAQPDSTRVLYLFRGNGVKIGGRAIDNRSAIAVRPDVPAPIENGDAPSELLVLQGRAIREPVVQHGPFVMNTRAEIVQAFEDYRATQFGGWPWPDDAPVHARERGRFARHADGKEELAP
ncbi:MAG TPA: pirin family protein [Nannocystaceae bacterium]|nr:pirin family protein [Nannocystaceae bacterium]